MSVRTIAAGPVPLVIRDPAPAEVAPALPSTAVRGVAASTKNRPAGQDQDPPREQPQRPVVRGKSLDLKV